MADEDLQDKTEEATPKRVSDAREEGQLPRSRELNGLAMLLAGSTGLLVVGDSWADHWQRLVQSIWRADVVLGINTIDTVPWLLSLFMDVLMQMAPWLGGMYLIAFSAPLLLSGWSFSTKALGFKFDRLSPAKGLKRMFGVQGLVELLKALAKFVLVAIVAITVFQFLDDEVMALGKEPIKRGIGHGAWLVGRTFLLVSCALILIAAVDVPYQIWQHTKNLRMSRQQIKDEMKQTEGDPHLKARVRQTQREMARARMMSAVPTADVIVTNPEHYAVAFQYDIDTMAAPVMVAKGMDFTAEKIREIAAEHQIPVIRSPLVARTSYYSTEIGDVIPLELFQAVAQILAHVYDLADKNRPIGAGPDGLGRSDLGADESVPAEYAQSILHRRGKQ